MINSILIWPDFPPQTDVKILPLDILAPLIRKDFQEILRIQKVSLETRNPVYRLWIKGDGPSTVIVKWFLPELDRFYASRYRREDKILSLLNWWFDNKAPKRYGGIITNDFAVLVEQDLGGQTLDVTLANTESEAEEFTIALQSVEFIEEFHRICQEHYTAFYRTCYSTDLDRLTRKTYLRRARIALGRLLLLGHFLKEKISIEGIQRLSASQLEALAIEHFGDEFFAWYIDKIATPLVHAPRQILHNSLSPFHLVWNDSLYLIDFETMSVGAAQIDLAEFLGAPEINLSCEKQLTLVERYYELRGNAKQQEWSAFVANYYNALVSRNLDYLGTTAFRYIKYAALGEEERAFLQLNRARQYQSRVLEAVKAGHGNTLPCDIPQV